MRDAIVYLRTPGRRFGVPPESFVDSIPALLEADPEALASLDVALRDYSGFLNQHDLETVVSQHIVSPDTSSGIASLIWEATKFICEWNGHPKGYIDALLKSLKQSGAVKLDAGQRKDLEKRLLLFIKAYPSVRRQWKAESLAEEIGVSLDEFRIISDLRPVFTDNRETVEGLFPVTLCKLVWTDVDGMPRSIAIRLTEDELGTLAKQIDLARTKLNALKKLLKDNRLTMPITQSLAKEGQDK